ncbi:hypothetical protein AMAG_19843 [Allomyces macrogynus ATCC 38327]|uniref:Uncharacterized protein n=1 Tax=Allomyces macrogynus (strain ATCC 38327) TaxID=578462 RepID=A0A0L0T000_ALLM3|nr:hypothetical protein, variant [Allomyces macrogynus ATCC 38327]KNE68077.1 hypothetical protein AMAG_19843 [Allomyces macrogynus ATCC 38327]|eukprot:KNE68076.1 hypothetical protein, variant [Allomyces macrogynus ATCC 38327]
MVATLLADAAAHPDAPTGGRWGKDRLKAIRDVIHDAFWLDFIPSPFSHTAMNGAYIRAAASQNGPLAAVAVVKAMMNQGANLVMKSLTGLIAKLHNVLCIDQAEALIELVNVRTGEKFPRDLIVQHLYPSGK